MFIKVVFLLFLFALAIGLLMLIVFGTVAGFKHLRRKWRLQDAEDSKRLREEAVRELQEGLGVGYTPGSTIPREFRSGIQNKTS